MKHQGSEITTSPEEQLSKTGMQAGEHGSGTLASSQRREVQERLAAHSPSETNSRLVSSARQCSVVLRERYEPRFQQVVMVASAQSAEALDKVADRFAHAMTPPSPDQIEEWVAELSVITARRDDDPATEMLRLDAFARRLSDYPADIVRHALLTKRWKFFPVWSELAEACDELLLPRRRMIRAIEDAQMRARALPTKERATLTPEELAKRKAATQALVDDVLEGMNAGLRQQRREAQQRAQATEEGYAKAKGAAE